MKAKIKKIFLIPLVLLLTVITISSYTSCSENYGAVVRTNEGLVDGYKDENNILTFKGIPYAEPPIGDLRWAPPHNYSPWKGIKDCTQWGNACYQDDVGTGWNIQPQSEDCLNLNIWTPRTNTNKLMPVYVYIHGGVFAIGASSQEVFDGKYMSYDQGKKDIVVVTINYRLQGLGFMALNSTNTHALNDNDKPLYWQDSTRSSFSNNHGTEITDYPIMTNGNWGLLDQIKALQWIHKNIQYFGGDNSNITISGESAGSFSVSSLIISPATDPNVQSDGKDLFQHAVMESGNILGFEAIANESKGVLTNPNYDPTNPNTKHAGAIQVCEDMVDEYMHFSDTPAGLRALRDVPATWVVEWTKINWSATNVATLHTYTLMPSFDGWALPLDNDHVSDAAVSETVTALKEGKFRNVDTIFGWNTGEGYGFVSEGTQIDDTTFGYIVQDRLRTDDDNSIDFDDYKDNMDVPATIPDSDYTRYLRELIKVAAFSAGTKEFVDQMKLSAIANNLPSKNHFMYNFNYYYWYPSPYYQNAPCIYEGSDWTINDELGGTAHTAELPFVFGTTIENGTLEDKQMSNLIMTYWTNFAKNGNVLSNVSPLPSWLPIDRDSLIDEEHCMIFQGGKSFDGSPIPHFEQMGMIADRQHISYIEDFYNGNFQ